MSRKDKSRKKARKARKLVEQEARARVDEQERLNSTPINHSRLRQLFSNMSFRSNIKGGSKPFADYVLGPQVEASTPEDLVEKTDEFYVEQSLEQEPS